MRDDDDGDDGWWILLRIYDTQRCAESGTSSCQTAKSIEGIVTDMDGNNLRNLVLAILSPLNLVKSFLS